MPKFTDIPSLELVYTVQASEYSYAGLEISSLFSAENQISLVYEFDTIKKNDVIVASTALSSSERTQLQRIPSTLYSIDRVQETVSHTIPGSIRVVDGSTFEYTVDSDASPDTPLLVQRAVNISEASVVFQPGSRLTSDQLNVAVQQCFLSVQELYGLSSLAEGSVGGGGGGGASALADLLDVTVFGPLDRQALVFDEFTQQWQNTPLTKQDLFDFNESDYATPSDLAVLTNAIGLNTSSITALQNDMPDVLDDLTDVDTTSVAPQDGQVLVYNDLDSKWYPGDGPGDVGEREVTLPTAYVRWSSTPSVTLTAGEHLRLFGLGGLTSPSITGDQGLDSNNFDIVSSGGVNGFVAPRDGVYTFDTLWQIRGQVSAQLDKVYGQYMIDGVTQDGASYNYHVASGTTEYPSITHPASFYLSAGANVDYKITADVGSGSVAVRYAQMVISSKTFDVTLAGASTAKVTLPYIQRGSFSGSTGMEMDTVVTPTRQLIGNTSGGYVEDGDLAGTSTDHWVAPSDMRVYVEATARIENNTAITQANLAIRKNGIKIMQDASYRETIDPTSLNYSTINISHVVDVVAGDYIEIPLSCSAGTFTANRWSYSIQQQSFDATLAGGLSLTDLKAEVAASVDFADFKARIAAL